MELEKRAICWEQVVNERHSVRTFTGEPLSAETSEMLQQLVDRACENGRGIYRLVLSMAGTKDVVGTYGMVRGAAACVVVVISRAVENAAMPAARATEHIVLRLVEAGVGTCWLGVTYHIKEIPLDVNEKVAAVVAVGVPAKTPHLMHRLTSAIAHSRKRRPFDRLFVVLEDSRCRQALELVRLAPSAMNRQPWHAVETTQGVHFYCDGESLMSDLDMGIAMAHFELAAPQGEWKKLGLLQMRGCRYVISYVFGAK